MMNVRQKMNGGYFAGRKIKASVFDGEERFKKSGAGQTRRMVRRRGRMSGWRTLRSS